MKFLIINTMKDTFAMVPLAIQRQLLEATLAWMDEEKRRGKLLEAYITTDGDCIVIGEYSSAEEVVQMEAAIPIGGFLDTKVYPLADYRKSMKAFIKACKQAEKLFPSAPK